MKVCTCTAVKLPPKDGVCLICGGDTPVPQEGPTGATAASVLDQPYCQVPGCEKYRDFMALYCVEHNHQELPVGGMGPTGCVDPETGEPISDSEFIRRFPERVPGPVLRAIVGPTDDVGRFGPTPPRRDGPTGPTGTTPYHFWR